jgi:choline dehydrogenase
MSRHDYVIAGGGSAGCVLAARLSQDPAARVLLLEAGGHPDGAAFADPAAWPGLVGCPADWDDRTVPQADAGPLPYPRGRVLGGGGSVNAMAHVRGHRAVYDGVGRRRRGWMGLRGPAAVLPAQRAPRRGQPWRARG